VTGLVRAVHDALNATAVPRRPDPGTLPPLERGVTEPLPVPPPPVGDLGGLLARRRSSYSFGPAPTRTQLAGLLHHGVGGAPRAGGLPSLRSYVVTRRGVDRADLRLPVPGLVPVRRGDPTAYVGGAVDQPPLAARVPTWVALVADPAVAVGRYPERHYRTMHVDAGLAVQSLLLVATSLGLRTCPVMGYDDAAWARLLGLDDDAFVVVLVAVGRPPGRG
jgi:SagB-type dehydrogenase family enzyme